jgi:hypothetical protein
MSSNPGSEAVRRGVLRYQLEQGVDLGRGRPTEPRPQESGGAPGFGEKELRLLDLLLRDHAPVLDSEPVFLRGESRRGSQAARLGQIRRVP